MIFPSVTLLYIVDISKNHEHHSIEAAGHLGGVGLTYVKNHYSTFDRLSFSFFTMQDIHYSFSMMAQ